jgi:hypothetical protein
MITDKWGNTWQIATYSDTNPRNRNKEAEMQRVVRAFPVLPGQEKSLQELVSQLADERAKEAAEFFRRFGVTHESWHAQETPAGTWVIGVTEISDVPVEVAAEGYARSEQPFDSWFKERVREITGIDPNTTPLGPPTQCIFNWSLYDG